MNALLQIPEEGLASPIIDDVGPREGVQLVLMFRAPLDPGQMRRLFAVSREWFATYPWRAKGGRPQLKHHDVNSDRLRLELVHVRRPRVALEALIARLHAAGAEGAGLHELILTRLGATRADCLALIAPGQAPQRAYEDADEYWRACFDAALAPPLSENNNRLLTDESAVLERADGRMVEWRGNALHLTGLRIAWGLIDAVPRDHTPGAAPTEARVGEVNAALAAALDRRFEGCWREPFAGALRPAPCNQKGERGALDLIEARGVVGYRGSFAADDLLVFLDEETYRYREYELFLAVRDATRAAGLAPVITWERQGKHYILQLWERATV